MNHAVTVTDTTATRGYGSFGHGTWRVACSCGWTRSTSSGGKNAADMAASDHRGHAANSHTRPVYGCVECGR